MCSKVSASGGNRLRVNVQLIDAETGITFGRAVREVHRRLFEMQDEIVSLLANISKLSSLLSKRAGGASAHPMR